MRKARLKVLELSFEGSQIEVRGAYLTGLEEVYVDGDLVSQKRNFRSTGSVHEFGLPGRRLVELRIRTHFTDSTVDYELIANGVALVRGQYKVGLSDAIAQESAQKVASNTAEHASEVAQSGSIPPKARMPWLSFGALALKLFKSGGVIKAALFGASYASFSLLTDWRLGALLIAILVFHEYGHLRAMRSFGMKTKGMYLIPFVGGVAVGEKATTYWQETYISMQGPVFGLYMTLLAWGGYAISGWDLLGALASFSALINMFNLLPVYPLDGGHVVKACALSLSKGKSWVFLALFAAFGVAGSIWSGLYLLAFFAVIGALDLLGAQRAMRDKHVVPMNGYGVAVSLGWYVGTICIFLFVMYRLYEAGVPGANIPMLILQDR